VVAKGRSRRKNVITWVAHGRLTTQAQRSREVQAAVAAESEAVAAALGAEISAAEARSREVQRMREESEELRE
jgi:hypothetical protein